VPLPASVAALETAFPALVDRQGPRVRPRPGVRHRQPSSSARPASPKIVPLRSGEEKAHDVLAVPG